MILVAFYSFVVAILSIWLSRAPLWSGMHSLRKQLMATHPVPQYPIVWSENVSPELVMRAVYYEEHGGEEVMKLTDFMIRPKPSPVRPIALCIF
jgi:hypothetical protein